MALKRTEETIKQEIWKLQKRLTDLREQYDSGKLTPHEEVQVQIAIQAASYAVEQLERFAKTLTKDF